MSKAQVTITADKDLPESTAAATHTHGTEALNKAFDHIKGKVKSEAKLADVWRELDRARRKFPTWPTDPLHALAVLQEEVGELQQAVLQRCYESDKASIDDVRTEAIQVAAMSLRFLASLPAYVFRPGEQHYQRVGCAACDRGDLQLGHADGCSANA